MQQYSFDLTSIGATDEVYGALQPYAERGLQLGRISIVHREQYRLYTADGEMKAAAIGALLYRAENASELPAVGDWVAVQPTGPDEAMIHAVLPRRTAFSRRAAGEREQEQMIAANIDLVLIVCGLDHDFNPRRIERYLTLARESGADAAVVLNKADLCADPETRVGEVSRIASGAPVVSTCARLGRRDLADSGPDRPWTNGRATRFVRSRQIDAGEPVARRGAAARSGRPGERQPGRHTTTYRELVPLPNGGALIDTPGMRELALWAGPASLDSTFSDVAELSQGCRFRDCAHGVEAGCAVQAAILEGKLAPERWQSYQKLHAEIAWQERKIDITAALKEKQRWKKIHKAMRSPKRW